MKKVLYFMFLLLWLFAGNSFARSNLDSLFNEAYMLNSKREYSRAAKLFSSLQDMALAAGDVETYILSLTAEGECHYMLDAATDMAVLVGKAKAALREHAGMFGAAKRLWLQECVLKLTGSYYSSLAVTDGNASTKAEKAYRACLEIIDSLKKMPGSGFDDAEASVIVHRELLGLYYNRKDYHKALEESDAVYYYWLDMGYDSGDTSPSGIGNYHSFIDAVVSRAMVLARLKMFDEALEVLAVLPGECSDEPSVLRTKGKILLLQHGSSGADNRAEAATCYKRYLEKAKSELEAELEHMTEARREQYWLAMHDFLFDCYLLGDYAPGMLYDLALFSKGYLLEYAREGKATKSYRWQDVRRKLGRNECAVEFVQYKGCDGDVNMAALVLKKESKSPQFINIGPVKEITSLPLRDGYTLGSAMAHDDGAAKDVLYSDSVWFRKVWTDSLLGAIGECDRIFFAPDGFIHQLAVEYVLPGGFASCRRLSSTRMLLSPGNSSLGKTLLCGGIDYNAAVDASRRGNDAAGYIKLKSKNIYIAPLEGTAKEVESIYSLRKSAACGADTLLCGGYAADDTLLGLAASGYDIIHVATHGYFTGENVYNDLKLLYSDSPMSESGIIMAGAGRNLHSRRFNHEFSDGIITAKELSAVNLSGVSLLVLSACQSGVGYITPDGVYGIQRAAKMAGAKALVVSLWSVDDAATTEFMKIFYGELAKENGDAPDICRAFESARKIMASEGRFVTERFSPASMGRRKVSKNISSPRYTNAFILVDAL